MKIALTTNHHYYENTAFDQKQMAEAFGLRRKREVKQIEEAIFSSTHEITTHSADLAQLKIVGFKNRRNLLEEEPALILKTFAKGDGGQEKRYFIQTGLFAGVVYHNGIQFNIGTPYGDIFLRRMLNFVNDIYVDTSATAARKSEEQNTFQHILAYLFIQRLEKAAVLGLPKVYRRQSQRSPKVRGKVDINAYLKKDIPFSGQLTTSYREQVYVPEIVDVLYTACKILAKQFGNDIHRKVLGVFNLLKQHYSGVFPTRSLIHRAQSHPVLHNPMFSHFRTALDYAEIIIRAQNLLLSDQDNALTTHGYLFDISQLFEVYLEKLLHRHLKDWFVTGQEEIEVYEGQFYRRRMYPDLVLRHKEKDHLIVFDAKFKTMDFKKRDLDRDDFYQIHSYIKYYQPRVILGGLLYPLRKEIDTDKAYATDVFHNPFHETSFIIDGIHVNKDMNTADIIQQELEFVQRMERAVQLQSAYA